MKHEKIFSENFWCLRNFLKRKFQRKAELPMNVIVMAAIALLVLVILAIIFMGRMGVFGKQVAACANQGGECKVDCELGEIEYGPATGACDAETAGTICCIPSPTPTT